MKRWRNLDPGLKQLVFVVGVLGGGFELVLLVAWLIGGDNDAGWALLFINSTVLVCVSVIRLAMKLFPEEKS